MTVLQIGDFPAELFEQVKESASAHHRSFAQEIIVLVGRGLQSERYEKFRFMETRSHQNDYGLSFDTDAERASRIQKKKEIFAYLDSLPCKTTISTQEIVDLIRESREERTNTTVSILHQGSKFTAHHEY